VTFAAAKLGHLLSPACDFAGELVVADIGIPAQVLPDGPDTLRLVEREDAAAVFGDRPPRAHKGTFGHVLVLAGSPGRAGAAVMAGVAALRTGAGLVTVATPAPVLPIVAGARAELMTEALPWGEAGLEPKALEQAIDLARARDAVVLGPGLGQGAGTRDFVRAFVRRCPVPLVVDADGLNALADTPLDGLRGGLQGVLTPHPGEMARLLSGSTAGVQRHRLESVRALAARTGAVAVLKGQHTLVAEPDGTTSVNPTGNAGMATGGTGDVLAGMVAALLARGLTGAQAARVGVFVHGLAGDLAVARLGQEGMLAGDVIQTIPAAILALTDGETTGV
jgi:ADP-dependent NAD(P)H-hydrate dehydratase / NAD(P)H-hydrate epimerase